MSKAKPHLPVKSMPTGDALYESAVRALARRARSAGEVRTFLQHKKATKAQIEEVIWRLTERGYLDDARFAGAFAAARLDGDLHGKNRIRRDLGARRVKPEIAEQAVAKAFEGVNEAELLRQYLRRKVVVSRSLAKPSAVASLYRRLLRAGFSSATIVQELKKVLPSPYAARRPGQRSDDAPAAEPVAWDELLDSLSETSDTEADLDQ
jgi:regulatory protein